MTFQNKIIYPRRLTPPISALAAFEAVARLGSFTDAANELALTQSAVSRQISSLESLLGVALFEGNRRKQVITTPSGAFYSEQVRFILSSLAVATTEAMALGGQGRALRIGIPPTFGSRWLIERVPHFFAAYPNIAISFQTHVPHRSKQNLDNLDALIDFLPATQAQPDWHQLIELDFVLVATRNIRKRFLETPKGSKSNIQILVHNVERQILSDLLARPEMQSMQGFPTLTFENYAMLFQAIDSEIGIGLAPRIFIEKELSSGKFEMISDIVLHSKNVGYLVIAPESSNYPPLDAFRKWILAVVNGL